MTSYCKWPIMRQMQKAILSSSLYTARMFKLSAEISIGILDTYFNRYLILYIIETLLHTLDVQIIKWTAI